VRRACFGSTASGVPLAFGEREEADLPALSSPGRPVREGRAPLDGGVSRVPREENRALLVEAGKDGGHRRQAGALSDLSWHGTGACRVNVVHSSI
jgi:hypothetical protein